MDPNTTVRRPYVVSEDIVLLLDRWARKTGFILPGKAFFDDLRREMKKKLEEIFPGEDTFFVQECTLYEGISSLLTSSARSARLPIVSLDRVYFNGGVSTIESTRMINHSLEQCGVGSRTQEPLDSQFCRIAQELSGRAVQLVDDVIFSSDSIVGVSRRLRQLGVRVVRVVAGITVEKAKQELISAFPDVEVSSVVNYESVTDEVCERDFYAGVPLSGRLLGENGLPFFPEEGAPYFLPFGKPKDWATIPKEHEKEWSLFCLHQSIRLWRDVEKVSGRGVHCCELERRPRGIECGNSLFVERLEREVASV